MNSSADMKIFTTLAMSLIVGTMASWAQDPDTSLLELLERPTQTDSVVDEEEPAVLYGVFDMVSDTADVQLDTVGVHYTPLRLLPPTKLPVIAFLPVVYDGLYHIDSAVVGDPTPYLASDIEALNYWRNLENQSRHYRQLKQTYMIYNMPAVKYNINTLPKPPAKYEASVDPTSHKITVIDIKSDINNAQAENMAKEARRRNWMHQFDANLQFSQAYVSRNWYQGGNNNVNVLGNLVWNVKLNQKFNPKYILEATTQYKLGVTSTHDDTAHDFLINQDQFQFNATAGLRAVTHWYYSMTTQFKTQLFNYYPSNSHTLQSAFMTPGELNVGLGMTYSLNNDKRKLSLNVSLAPLSYNLKTSINHRIDPTAFGLKPNHHTQHSFGSNAELKLTWQIMWNIAYTSRLFMFTNYDYGQADWENTLSFSVNRYLSTQLFWHLRYDSSQPSRGGWHKWQFKEILSFGLAYQFKSY